MRLSLAAFLVMVATTSAIKLPVTELSQVGHEHEHEHDKHYYAKSAHSRKIHHHPDHKPDGEVSREDEIKEYQRIAMKELQPALAAVKEFAGDHSIALLGMTPIGDLFGIGKAPPPSRVKTTDNGDGTGCSCSGGSAATYNTKPGN